MKSRPLTAVAGALLLATIWLACDSDDPATPVESAACTVTPDTVDFGPVSVGGNVLRTIEIENSGERTLEGDIGVSTSAPCDGFSIVSGAGPFSLPPSEILSIQVRLEPASTGEKRCRLETGTGLCGNIELAGRAAAPAECRVEPESIDFGAIRVGTARDTTFTITNVGGGFLSGSVTESCGPVSILSGRGAYSLGAGESRVVTIRFQPAEGSNSCTVETGTARCSDVLVTGVTAFPDFVATAVGESGTILRSSDGGGTWVHQSSGTSRILGAVCFSDTSTGTAVGQGGTILRTTDGGGTWVQQTSNTTAFLTAVSFTDTNNGTAVGNFGAIVRTTDGGVTWTPQTSNTSEHLRGVWFTDGNTGTAVGWAAVILRTVDGGNNWVMQNGGTNRLLAAVWFEDANIGMIATTGSTTTGLATSQLLQTSDGGDHWSIQQPAPDVFFNAMSFVDASTGTLVGADGEIITTSDGGDTWTTQSSGITNINGVALLDANVGVAVGANGKIIETVDGGASWVERPSGTSVGLRSVSVVGY